MNNTTLNLEPNKNVLALTERAREAHGSLKLTWENWVTIGKAIDAYRSQLLRVLKINRRENQVKFGSVYGKAMSRYLIQNGFHQSCKNGLNGTLRTNLQS
jgi:hypothetical protein